MSETLTIRLDHDELMELRAQASARGLAVTALGSKLVVDALGGPEPRRAPVDGPVVIAVMDAADRWIGLDAEVRRAVAVALAHIIDGGGAGAPGAARQLLAMTSATGAEAEDFLRRVTDWASSPIESLRNPDGTIVATERPW